jgi:hypothetical protein
MSSNSSGNLFAPNERGCRTLLGLPQCSRHRCILVIRRTSDPTFGSDGFLPGSRPALAARPTRACHNHIPRMVRSHVSMERRRQQRSGDHGQRSDRHA